MFKTPIIYFYLKSFFSIVQKPTNYLTTICNFRFDKNRLNKLKILTNYRKENVRRW